MRSSPSSWQSAFRGYATNPIVGIISCGDILTASGAVTGTVIEGPRTAPSGRARRCPCVFERPSVCTRSWRRFEDRTCARSEMHMS